MPELPDLEVYFQGIEDQALCGWLGEALGTYWLAVCPYLYEQPTTSLEKIFVFY